MRDNSLIKISVLLLFFSLVVSLLFLYTKNHSTAKHRVEVDYEEEIATNKNNESWRRYTNEEYGFSLEHPPLLLATEYEKEGEYEFFVSFDENEYSEDEGVRVGLSKSNIETLINIVEEGFGESYEVVDEITYELGDTKITQKTYIANDSRKKTIALFEKEGYTYSISTSPGQIERVLEGFQTSADNST